MKTTEQNSCQQRPIRIFHVITHLALGGAERVAINIAKSETAGTEYHIVELMRARGSLTRSLLQELRAAGVRSHRWFAPDIRFHFLFERIAALLFPLWFLPVYLRWRPDVLHFHTESTDLACLAFFRLLPWIKKPVIVRTIHNTQLWTGQKRIGEVVETLYKQLNANVAISPSVRDSYQKAYGQSPQIVFNGVTTVPQQRYPRRREGRINVLFAGRFEEQKGIVHLAEVLRRMADDDRYFFHIIGDGSLRSLISSVADSIPNAEISPTLPQLSSFIASFDCLFMPSEFEGLSILSIESSMEGVPVVANNCPGLSDTLPEQWLLKVENNDHNSYERLFREVIPTTDMAALGQQARRFAEEKFSIRQMQTAYENIYRRHLESTKEKG